MPYPSLFRHGQINQTTLHNRILLAPMTRISAAEDGVPGETMRRYYTRFARGGFGALITEGIYVDQAWSQTYQCQPGIVNDRQVAAWREIVHDVRRAGSAIIAQLIHAGALSQANIWRDNTVAPSAVQPKGQQLAFYHGNGDYPLPEAMSEEQIQQVIRSFADSAGRAIAEAEFDGVEIHAANGYLLDQFFTDYTNKRTDRWGGDIAARLALTLEVIHAVRSKIGQHATLGVRISQGKVNDFHHKWQEGERGAREVFRLLQEAGVDYIHVTEYRAWQPAFSDSPLSLVEIARQAAPDTVIIANGGLDNGELAEQLLQQGADFVAIGKAALANPDWPLRVNAGETLQDLPADILAPIANIKPGETQAG